MGKRVLSAVLLMVAMMMPDAALATGRTARIYLQFWTMHDDFPEPIELVLPRTTNSCPPGYLLLTDSAHCGRAIAIRMSLDINGELYPGCETMVQYEPTEDGAWITFVTGYPNSVYSTEVTPFQDGVGLWHHVVGTIKLTFFEDQTWVLEHRPGQPFLAESREQQPMTVHLECAIGQLPVASASL